MKKAEKFRVEFGENVEVMSKEELKSFLNVAVLNNEDITSFSVKDVSEDSTDDIVDLLIPVLELAGELYLEVIATAMLELQNNPGTSIQEALLNGMEEWIK